MHLLSTLNYYVLYYILNRKIENAVLGFIMSVAMFHFLSNLWNKKNDENFDIHNPTEFFDNDDKAVSEYLTADLMKMRLYRAIEVDWDSGTGFKTINEFLKKENENGKIMIKEVIHKSFEDNYGRVEIKSTLPHEEILEKYAKLSFTDGIIFTPQEREAFEDYKKNFSPTDLNEELLNEFYKELEIVGNWNHLPYNWENMVTNMFVEIRNYYAKKGNNWRPTELH